MSAPQRIQMRRTKGWRKPEGAVYVGRPSAWGNPFPWQGSWITWLAVGLGYRGDAAGRRAAAVALYRSWLTEEPARGVESGSDDGAALEFSDGSTVTVENHCRGIALGAASLMEPPKIPAPPPLDALRGRDLACWCPLDVPCHADVLLEVANQ